MRITILGSFHGGANCVQYAKAFRELGHQVTTAGPPFTEQDAARWRAGLLAMAWPPSEEEADRYMAAVLSDSPKPDLPTEKGALVAAVGPYDALLSFWQYGETPWYVDPGSRGSSALILGDTHTGYLPLQVEYARHYPHVFVQFRPSDLSAFADHPSAHWLPAAADPDIWDNGVGSLVRRDIPVLFIGSTTPAHERRCELLRLLSANLGERLQVKHVFGRDAARLIRRADLVLNCSLAGDLNMRVPETMMAGGCLLTDDVPGLARFGLRSNGAPGLGYIYQSPTQCLSICHLLLKESKHPWQTPRYPAHAHAMSHSTYQHRCRELLACMGLENGVEAPGGMG